VRARPRSPAPPRPRHRGCRVPVRTSPPRSRRAPTPVSQCSPESVSFTDGSRRRVRMCRSARRTRCGPRAHPRARDHTPSWSATPPYVRSGSLPKPAPDCHFAVRTPASDAARGTHHRSAARARARAHFSSLSPAWRWPVGFGPASRLAKGRSGPGCLDSCSNRINVNGAPIRSLAGAVMSTLYLMRPMDLAHARRRRPCGGRSRRI